MAWYKKQLGLREANVALHSQRMQSTLCAVAYGKVHLRNEWVRWVEATSCSVHIAAVRPSSSRRKRARLEAEQYLERTLVTYAIFSIEFDAVVLV